MLVLATDVDGVLDEKGNVVPLITRSNFAEVSKHLRHTDNDVTGGMKGKIEELLALDTVAYIVNGSHPERIEAVFSGKPVLCTQVNEKR